MPYVLVKHRVADFGKWKPAFDSHITARKAAGLTDVHVLRDSGDPNTIILLMESADLAKAKAFAQSADLKEKMQTAGVVGQPDVMFLNKA
ncbi:MAG TPA: hypothetical protein VIM11_08045 [Tepidisphaeraceae bacterium]|jgi:hypothetical protein